MDLYMPNRSGYNETDKRFETSVASAGRDRHGFSAVLLRSYADMPSVRLHKKIFLIFLLPFERLRDIRYEGRFSDMDVRLSQTNSGGHDEVSSVIKRYADMVYRIAYMRTKTPHDADDVFQNVFLSYMQAGRSFESEEHRKAWLIRVTVNCCRKLLGSSWFQKTVPLEDDALTYELPEQQGLYEAVRRLPKKYGTVLYLFYFEQMKVSEISSALGIQEKTVRMQLTRARRLLKDYLESEEAADE